MVNHRFRFLIPCLLALAVCCSTPVLAESPFADDSNQKIRLVPTSPETGQVPAVVQGGPTVPPPVRRRTPPRQIRAGKTSFSFVGIRVVDPKTRPAASTPNPTATGQILATQAPSAGKLLTTTTTPAAKVISIKIPDFLVKIINFFGGKLAIGSRIVITIPKKPTTPTPTPVPTPTPTPTTPNPTGNIAQLRQQIINKFGINPQDGSGATWSLRQMQEAYKVLDSLPESFRRCTTKIQRDSVYQSASILGYVRMGIPTVHMMNSSCKEGTFQGTLVHEMTHCFQSSHPDITKLWEKTFWPWGKIFGARPSSVSSYGNSQPLEDMAESVRVYWQGAAKMKREQPQRYDFIKKYVMGGREFPT